MVGPWKIPFPLGSVSPGTSPTETLPSVHCSPHPSLWSHTFESGGWASTSQPQVAIKRKKMGCLAGSVG